MMSPDTTFNSPRPRRSTRYAVCSNGNGRTTIYSIHGCTASRTDIWIGWRVCAQVVRPLARPAPPDPTTQGSPPRVTAGGLTVSFTILLGRRKCSAQVGFFHNLEHRRRSHAAFAIVT